MTSMTRKATRYVLKTADLLTYFFVLYFTESASKRAVCLRAENVEDAIQQIPYYSIAYTIEAIYETKDAFRKSELLNFIGNDKSISIEELPILPKTKYVPVEEIDLGY